jgi:hypothetical protein
LYIYTYKDLDIVKIEMAYNNNQYQLTNMNTMVAPGTGKFRNLLQKKFSFSQIF